MFNDYRRLCQERSHGRDSRMLILETQLRETIRKIEALNDQIKLCRKCAKKTESNGEAIEQRHQTLSELNCGLKNRVFDFMKPIIRDLGMQNMAGGPVRPNHGTIKIFCPSNDGDVEYEGRPNLRPSNHTT